MAIKYKIKQYSNADSRYNGWYYARAFSNETIDLAAIGKRIERNCTAKYSDVMAVLTELIEVMTDELQDGKRVILDGIGSFKVGLHATLVESSKDCTANTITGYKINFTPEYTVTAGTGRTYAMLDGVQVQKYNEYRDGVNDKDLD